MVLETTGPLSTAVDSDFVPYEIAVVTVHGLPHHQAQNQTLGFLCTDSIPAVQIERPRPRLSSCGREEHKRCLSSPSTG